jgi:hypothetical protein
MKLSDEGGSTFWNYESVSTWTNDMIGVNNSPLDYNIILFLRNNTLHWFMYDFMFPKKKHQRMAKPRAEGGAIWGQPTSCSSTYTSLGERSIVVGVIRGGILRTINTNHGFQILILSDK